MPSRLLVFDRTCTSGPGGLSPIWSLGSHLYRGLRRIDATCGVASWDEALGWLATQPAPIEEIQFWGHGKWGAAMVGNDVLDARSLGPSHPHRKPLDALAEGLAPDALIWFRTCETLGAARGIDFAERLSDRLGARVAGHTFIIGFHQSGLHGVSPGVRADWSPEEGLAEGTAEAPRRAKWSTPLATRTITCLAGRVPEGWFASAAGNGA
ncbi:MAG: DUF4347 domain-containing protein [Minicystis sp.]